MAPVDFIAGPVSVGTARVLAIGVAAYALATMGHTWTAFKQRLEDRGSALLASFVMAGLSVLLWTEGARLLPAPFSLAVLGIYMAGILITLGYTLSDAAKSLERWRAALKEAVDEWSAKALPPERREAWIAERVRLAIGPEERRKTPHLMMGVFLLIYTVLGALIVQGLLAVAPADADTGRESWYNLQATLDGGRLAAGHMVGVTLLLGLLFLLLPVELVRLRYPELEYPFKTTILTRLRPKEAGLFGAHYYIAATLPLAILWLTQDPAQWDRTLYAVLAVLGVTVFADAISALVGIRFGRRKWGHNPNKSFMGTFGGSLAAFLLALPFVGLPVAVASAAVFLLVDVLAPIPFAASDNILNPLALAATYTVLLDALDPWVPYY